MGRDPIVLVTGAAGQVGGALVHRLPEAESLSREQLDVTDPAAVDAAVAGHDTVIHLAAMTNVDRCEIEPERAEQVNARGTENVAAAAARQGARLLYVSTDYVFDGRKGGAYSESDTPSPINVYGRTKHQGEMACAVVPEHLVVRSSWIFGEGVNFLSKVIERAREHLPLRVVDDQIGRPTSAEDLADALVFLLGTHEKGIVHVAGDGPPCSWADLASHALIASGIEAVVDRIGSKEYEAEARGPIAPRPANSTLLLDKARSMGVPLLDWHDSVQRYVRRSI